MRLVDKENTSHELSLHERLIRSGCPVKNAIDYVSDIDVVEDVIDSEVAENNDEPTLAALPVQTADDTNQKADIVEVEPEDLPTDASVVVSSPTGWTWLGGIVGDSDDIAAATKTALANLCGLLETAQVAVSDLVSVCLYVRDMSAYSHINSEYIRVLSAINPPVRVCVEAPLSPNTPVAIEAVAYTPAVRKPRALGVETPTDAGEKSVTPQAMYARHTMHVQGVSHWAPANIGPYSQSVRIGDMILVAGQIALVPGSMEMVEGGVRRQCRLALRHVGRVIKAMDANTQLRDVVQSVCYVTQAVHIAAARDEWEKRTRNAIVDYVVVPRLPRDALVEWHVWAHRGNAQFEYEETGFVVGCNRVSLCRRWNYDNTISAVVCSVSAGRSVSSLTVNESVSLAEPVQPMSEEQLVQVLSYSLSRLNRNASEAASLVCVLRIFFRADRSPSSAAIIGALGQVEGEGGNFKIVPTLVPVVELGHPNTFLSICAVRHV